jgi:hypothetical protein
MDENILYKVVHENVRSKLIVGVDKGTKLVIVRATLDGYSDTDVYMYLDELEKMVESARELMAQV